MKRGTLIFGLFLLGMLAVSTTTSAKKLINCSYIRGDFFEIDRVSGESMAACNDLIYLAVRPYANGDLMFELPDNDATLSGAASHEISYRGRSGVVKFEGTGKLNAGDGLLHTAGGADNPCNRFTFGTYIFLNKWTEGACIFRKTSDGKTLAALQLGKEKGQLKLTIGDATAMVENEALNTGGWHYIGVTFNKGFAKLYVDNTSEVNFRGRFPNEVPNVRADFVMGEGLAGCLDETFVNTLDAGTLGRSPIVLNNWMATKTLAYWKYDDDEQPGKDSHTWLTRLSEIRKALKGQDGERKLRLGIAGGQWREMIKSEAARTNFANKVKQTIDKYGFDGVDLDFEWASTAEEFADYSATILKMREVLGKNTCFTVSLHPVSYKISPEAIAAVDFISLQCYGPKVMRFPLRQFIDDAEACVAYGIPASKLVLGVPFFGTTGKAGGQTTYYDLVKKGKLKDTTVDEWAVDGKSYTFNGQETIRQKTRYACEKGYLGIMSWDLAADLDVKKKLSLNRAVKEELDAFEVQTVNP